MACFVNREIIARDMIKVPWWTRIKKFALKLFKVKEEKIILICFSKDTSQCFGIFFLKGCCFKASISYLITNLKRRKFNWNSPAQPVIVLNLIELPLSHHLHGFSWCFRRILNGVRQPKNTNGSTTDLQAETPALGDSSVSIKLKTVRGHSVLSNSKWLCKYYRQEQTLLK